MQRWFQLGGGVLVAAACGCLGPSGDAGGEQQQSGAAAHHRTTLEVEEAEAAAGAQEEALAAANDRDAIVPRTDPERTQRARKIYLNGVRLLSTKPPKVDRAMREFQKALEIAPIFYRAHFKLGICYYLKGQYHLEINEYKLALATNPKYVPAWLNLGHAHLVMDELERARAAYQHVLELEPKHAVALYNKALVEFDLSNEDEALRLFEQFMDVDGTGKMGQRAKGYIEEIKARRSATVEQG